METTEKRGRGRPPRPDGRRESHTHRFDPIAYTLATEMAAQLGVSMTAYVQEALRRENNRVKRMLSL